MKYTINDQEVSANEYYNSKQDGIHKSYYDNGKPKYEVPSVNGQIHGKERYWYDNGNLEQEIPYVNGQEHGIARWYHGNGKLKHEIPYVNGEQRDDLLLPKNRLAYLAIFGQKQPV